MDAARASFTFNEMRRRPVDRPKGFTLIELLLVIGCSLILIGLVLGTIAASDRRGKQVVAQTRINQLVVSVRAFHTEYGHYPALVATTSPGPESDEWSGDPVMGAAHHNNALLFTLRGISKGPNLNHRQNIRKVGYFDVPPARFSSGKPKDGLFDRNGDGSPAPVDIEGCLYDPWGIEYGVILDTTADGHIDVDSIYRDQTKGDTPIGAFSAGHDTALGKKGDRRLKSNGVDDLVSWQ